MRQVAERGLHALVLRHTFVAPRARVFACWTQPQLLRVWFAPPEFRVEADVDAREGGSYRLTLIDPSERRVAVEGSFAEVSVPACLRFSFRWDDGSGALEPQTFASVELIARGARTDMLFRQSEFLDAAASLSHEHGWREAFDRLRGLLGRRW